MLFIVDVESDGPVPPLYSMISFGAVAVNRSLNRTFLGRVAPLPGAKRLEAAAAISGVSADEHATYDDPLIVMQNFADWVKTYNADGRPIFVSDNPAFDWGYMNYYFHAYLGSNPFGYSARRIGDFYCGLTKDYFATWKKLRKTKHDHNPVNDAKGNAEALITMADQYGVSLPGVK
jgi:hypothetical protein